MNKQQHENFCGLEMNQLMDQQETLTKTSKGLIQQNMEVLIVPIYSNHI